MQYDRLRDALNPSVSIFSPLPRFSSPYSIAAGVITLIGAALRFYALGRQSFWFDEVCTWHSATYSTFVGLWQGDRAWNMYPPGHHLMLSVLIRIFGDGEIVLRMPSAIAGIASIPLLYCLGTRLYSEREGIVGAGIFSFSLFPIYYAQEARPYALLICAVLVSSLAWTWLIESWRESKPASWIPLLICFVANVFCAYLHYFGLLFVFVQGVVSFGLCARPLRSVLRAATFYSLSALFFAPWLPNMFWQFQRQEIGPQNPKPDKNIVVSFHDFIKGLFNHGQIDTRLADAITVCVLLAFVAAAVRFVFIFRNVEPSVRRRQTAFALVMLVWLFAPYLFAYIKSSVSASVFTHRNLSISLPAVYLLTARGLLSVPFPNKGRLLVGLALAVAALFRVFTSGFYTLPHKDQLREAVAFVRANESPNAMLVTYSHLPFTFDYYLQRQGLVMRSELVAGRANDIEKMRKLVRSRRPDIVWYLCTDPYPDNAFVDYLNAEFRIVGVQQFLRAHAFQLVPRY